jgi:hypothetical protein
MSADNWTECPKCSVAPVSRKAQLAEAYGKVTAEEYERLLAAPEVQEERVTLREDYYIGIRAGIFRVSYGASCGACGWRYTFEHRSDDLVIK